MGALGLTCTLTSLEPKMSVFHGQDVGYRGDGTRARLKPMSLLTRKTAGRLMSSYKENLQTAPPGGKGERRQLEKNVSSMPQWCFQTFTVEASEDSEKVLT